MRTIESLKENEAIIINSNEEYDAIAELLDKAGKRWCDGERYSDWKVYRDALSFSKYPIMLIVDKSIWDSVFSFCSDRIQASEFIEKKLPKYWVVNISMDRKRGISTVIKYINKVYSLHLAGDAFNYYGYDGNSYRKGHIDCRDSLTSFANNPTLLTIEEFLTYPGVRKVLELDEVVKPKLVAFRVPDDIKKGSAIIAYLESLGIKNPEDCKGSGIGTNYFYYQTIVNTIGYGSLPNNDDYIIYTYEDLEHLTKTTKQMKYKLLSQQGYLKEFFEKGKIYSEDYDPALSSLDVAYLVKNFPNDWELVEDGKDTRFPFVLTMTNAKRIIGKSCPEWQEKLGKLWGTGLLVYGYVEVSEDLYREVRNSTNNLIHELLDEIFGKDEVKLTYEDVMKSFDKIYLTSARGKILELNRRDWNNPNESYSKRIHEIQQAQLKLANVAKYLNKDKIKNGVSFLYI